MKIIKFVLSILIVAMMSIGEVAGVKLKSTKSGQVNYSVPQGFNYSQGNYQTNPAVSSNSLMIDNSNNLHSSYYTDPENAQNNFANGFSSQYATGGNYNNIYDNTLSNYSNANGYYTNQVENQMGDYYNQINYEQNQNYNVNTNSLNDANITPNYQGGSDLLHYYQPGVINQNGNILPNSAEKTNNYYSDDNSVDSDDKLINKIASDLNNSGEEIENLEPQIEGKLKENNVDPSKGDDFKKKYNKVMKKLKKYKEETKALKKQIKDNANKNKGEEKVQNKKENKKTKMNSKEEPELIKDDLPNLVKTSPPVNKNKQQLNGRLNWINGKIKQKVISILKGVTINSENDKLKLIAKIKIPKNENIVKINKLAILYKKHQETERLCEKIKAISEFQHNYDKICMSVFILKSKSNNLNLKGYFNLEDISKFNFYQFPIFFKDKELKLMKGTYFNFLVKARRDLLEREYNILANNNIIKKTDNELKDFMKSRLYVTSQNVKILTKSKESISAVIPLLDFIQVTEDTSKANCNFYYKDSNFYFTAIKEIKQGEELAIKNVNMSNDNLLLYYGYTVSSNKKKSDVYIDIKVNNKLPFNSTNKNFTSTEQSANSVESILLRSDYDFSKVLVPFRSILSGKDSLDEIPELQVLKNETNGFTNRKSQNPSPLSFDNEAQAVNLLKKAMKAKHDKYTTNYQSDQVMLSKKSLTKNEISIYKVIIEEKRRVKAYYLFASFFDKLFKLLKSGKIINDKLLRKISTTKAYKKYYAGIKNMLKESNYKEKSIENKINTQENKHTDVNNVNITRSLTLFGNSTLAQTSVTSNSTINFDYNTLLNNKEEVGTEELDETDEEDALDDDDDDDNDDDDDDDDDDEKETK